MLLGYKFIMKTKGVRPHEADLWTDKDIIDADEQAWIKKEQEQNASAKKADVIYRRTIGLLF